jgi:FKBP-type peptidyl-prolyl cis-trans isomerase FkpA
MKSLRSLCLLPLLLASLAACGPAEDDAGTQEQQQAQPQQAEPRQAEPAAGSEAATGEPVELEPGLTMRILKEGSGEVAEPGQTAVVHYTGWLHDPQAPGNRGEKFDSSLDRGQHFQFPLGAGAVIAGWDRGVAGMQVGEVRELEIAPELAYGDRGAGGVIPPGATLVFEVELADVIAAGE